MDDLKDLNLKALIERSARLYASKPAAAAVSGKSVTYAVFYNRVQVIRRFLKNKGIKPGDKVCLLGENTPNWPIAYFAVTTLSAAAVPILPEFHINEIMHIIRHSKSRAIFVSARFIDAVLENSPNELELMIRLDDFKQISSNEKKDFFQDILEKGEKELEKIKKAAYQAVGISDEGEELEHDIKESDTAVIIYTSGTTGHSKGVVLTHKNIISNALASRCVAVPDESDRFLSILPLAHTYECTLGMIVPLMCGSCVYYISKPPTPTILIDALGKVRPTFMFSVPLVMEKIYKNRILKEFNKSRLIRNLYKVPFIRRKLHQIAGRKMKDLFGGGLQFFGIGGAALSPDVENFLIEAGFPYAVGYGLTETSPLIAGFAPFNGKYRSTGPAIDGVEILINEPSPKTGIGEIWVRGANVMQEYYKDPDRTAEVLDNESWFKTGDLGYLDEDNYLFIHGRSKNVIVGASGENVYPEQIEALFNEFDGVMESLVFEQENQLLARIYLDYERLDEMIGINDLTEKEVQTKKTELLEQVRLGVNEKLSSFSRIQKVIEQPDPFEKTPTQKIKRYLYLNGHAVN